MFDCDVSPDNYPFIGHPDGHAGCRLQLLSVVPPMLCTEQVYKTGWLMQIAHQNDQIRAHPYYQQ